MAIRLHFLRDGGYFFDSGQGVHWTESLHPAIASLLVDGSGTPKVHRLMHIATADRFAFLHYQDTSGRSYIRNHAHCDLKRNFEADLHNEGHNLDSRYPELAKWLQRGKIRPGDCYHVALGSDGQFFAYSDHGCIWDKVPSQFAKHIKESLAGNGQWKHGFEPESVLFGMKSSYLITCKSGEEYLCSKNLVEHYPKLVGRLIGCVANNVALYKYITLNPYAADDWAIIWADGAVSCTLSPTILSMANPIRRWLNVQSNGHAITPPTSVALQSPNSHQTQSISSVMFSSASGQQSSPYAPAPPTQQSSPLFGTSNSTQPHPNFYRPTPLQSLPPPSNTIPYGSTSHQHQPPPTTPQPIAQPPATPWSQPLEVTLQTLQDSLQQWQNLMSMTNNSGASPLVDPATWTSGLGSIDPSGSLNTVIQTSGLSTDPVSMTTMAMGAGFDPASTGTQLAAQASCCVM